MRTNPRRRTRDRSREDREKADAAFPKDLDEALQHSSPLARPRVSLAAWVGPEQRHRYVAETEAERDEIELITPGRPARAVKGERPLISQTWGEQFDDEDRHGIVVDLDLSVEVPHSAVRGLSSCLPRQPGYDGADQDGLGLDHGEDERGEDFCSGCVQAQVLADDLNDGATLLLEYGGISGIRW